MLKIPTREIISKKMEELGYRKYVISGLAFLFVTFVALFSPGVISQSVYAKPYEAVYTAEYFLSETGEASVQMHVDITNTRADVYVRQFTLTFPSSFTLENIKAKDGTGPAQLLQKKGPDSISLIFTMANPPSGPRAKWNLSISFVQKNLFKVAGDVWELMLPVIQDEYATYNAKVHLPDTDGRKISLAKPLPTQNDGKTISWDDVQTKMIYAIFGDAQAYKLRLVYNVKNDSFVRKTVDVAFPPETLYQSVIVSSVKPSPDYVFIDQDGNYIGRFILSPKQESQILFDGFVQTMINPQQEMKAYIKNSFVRQKKYLLRENDFWSLGAHVDDEDIKNAKDPLDIYRFTVDKLDYNYKRISKDIKRLGAKNILDRPDAAVCMEFTDVFVGIAREKGIYAREVNGYAFSQDKKLRPLSLISDTLHAWPEYFNEKESRWIPVDPTWEDTSGIDYFASLDPNHIVLAIHGRDPTYPLAAGMYKLEDSKDLSIDIAEALPKRRENLKISHNVKGKLLQGVRYKTTVELSNSGNVFVKDKVIDLNSSHITFEPAALSVDLLAPMQTASFELIYYAQSIPPNGESLLKVIDDDKIAQSMVIKVKSHYWVFVRRVGGGFASVVLLVGLYIFISKRK